MRYSDIGWMLSLLALPCALLTKPAIHVCATTRALTYDGVHSGRAERVRILP